MNILLVVHDYPPTGQGGAERRAARTARELCARGHTVDVLAVETAPRQNGVGQRTPTVEDGVRVHRVHGANPPDSRSDAYDDNPHVASVLAGLLAQEPRDVVHQFSGYVTSASVTRTARAAGVPVVVSLTDYWWLCRRVTLITSRGQRCAGPSPAGCARCAAETRRPWRLLRRAAPRLAKAFWERVAPAPLLRGPLGVAREELRPRRMISALNQASALLSPSSFLADVYREHGVEPRLLHVSRQGVDLSVSPVRVPSPVLRVGYLGQIKDHKGVLLLLDAWGRLRGTTPRQLTLYGDDAGEPAYGRLVRDRIAHLLDVTWPGSFPVEALWSKLACLDVVVVPSRWDENSPNVVLEALAMGVVVVGTRRGGIPELVMHERNGLLASPDSSESLAEALQRLVDDPELVARLRKAAPESFRHFRSEVDDLEAIYRSVSDRKAAGSPAEPVAVAQYSGRLTQPAK